MAALLLHCLNRSSVGSVDSSLSVLESDCASANQPSSCLLLGEMGSGKTSLLFLTALLAASDFGLKVVFLAPTQLQTRPPSLHGSRGAMDPHGLKRIQFIYPRKMNDLLQYIASLHNEKHLPSLIVVDKLDEYVYTASGGSRPLHAVARVCALLLDTVSFVAQKRASTCDKGPGKKPCANCHVIVSFNVSQAAPEQNPQKDQVLGVIERYFPVTCLMDQESGREGQKSWWISFSSKYDKHLLMMAGEKRWSVTYSQNGEVEICAVSSEKGEKS
ncbi:ATPase SWSAP1 [Erpetoichthys calabaricus]|uniref:ATPase SWSAP1 n=1 Tax=Erpetoichthys calabaricus TaxID=27687 RepID=UPI0022341815|nr:ATPase SWSAP1 [Erpetoichthys calabaricus]